MLNSACRITIEVQPCDRPDRAGNEHKPVTQPAPQALELASQLDGDANPGQIVVGERGVTAMNGD